MAIGTLIKPKLTLLYHSLSNENAYLQFDEAPKEVPKRYAKCLKISDKNLMCLLIESYRKYVVFCEILRAFAHRLAQENTYCLYLIVQEKPPFS